MGRFCLIGLIGFLAIAYVGIGLGMYHYMKRITVNGKPLIEQPVNEQERTDKLGIGEFLVYFSMIIVAGICAMQIMQNGGVGSAILARLIILPPIMAFFNARKRTGKALLALVVSFMLALFLMMTYFIIGVPQKAPILTVNNSTIIITQTTAAEIMSDGFDIYIKKDSNSGVKYNELLSSGTFKKYSVNRSVFVEKGFNENNDAVPEAPYILVKEDVVIGSIGLYGSKTKDTVLEDCKIIHFKLDEDCIAAAKANSISYAFNGIDLLAPLREEELRGKFGEKLWYTPINAKEITQRWYGIKWTNHSEHLFWNEYYSYIRFDEQNNMTSFELMSRIAGE